MSNTAKQEQKCGMVSIIGRPNVGKSTLLNKIVGEKVAIVSRVPQTTRNSVRGIYNDERGQIIFIDTPGLHNGKDRLDKLMNQSASGAIEGMDCIIYLVDTSRDVGEEERNIAEKLKDVTVPVILGLNKIDLKTKNVAEYIALWEKVKGQPINTLNNVILLPLSGTQGTNIEKLIDLIFEHLPAGPLLYPTDIICDVPQKMAVADIIREKFFELLRQEVPHSLGVVVEQMQPLRKKVMNIKALILVERDSQKQIVIGHGGQTLKKAGMEARIELEELLGTKVFLECHVKADKGWRDDVALLQDCGYDQSQ